MLKPADRRPVDVEGEYYTFKKGSYHFIIVLNKTDNLFYRQSRFMSVEQ